MSVRQLTRFMLYLIYTMLCAMFAASVLRHTPTSVLELLYLWVSGTIVLASWLYGLVLLGRM